VEQTESTLTPTPTPSSEIEWIEDDLAAASQRASQSGKPILVDMWAPWCHTCLSMQQTVLRETAVTRHADQFVWLAIDTDREQNANAVEKLPMSFWPTFFVLDPDGRVVSSLAGAASPVQFAAFLDGARLTLNGASDAATQAARAAAQAMVARDWASAESHYRVAVEGAEGALRERVPAMLVDLAVVLRKQERWEPCVELAERELPRVAAGRAASTTDFIYYANACSEHVEAERGAGLRARLRDTLAALLDDDTAPLSLDDRSDGLSNLRALQIALGEEAEATVTAQRQAKLLDDAWAKETDPHRRLTHAWPRAEVADFLGHPETLIADYQALVEALPKEYEPPYRLAWVALQAGDAALAQSMAQRSAERAYGPRRARVLGLLADACKANGDAQGERDARAAIVEHWKKLPASMQRPDRLAEAEAALASLG
jgi:thioredoxin-like negative regulator of GroEL